MIMSDWTSYIDNREMLMRLYDVPPSLDCVGIRRMSIIFENSLSIVVRITNLPFPQHPPLSWLRNQYNRCAINLKFFEVQNITNEVNVTTNDDKNFSPCAIFLQDNIQMTRMLISPENINILFSFSSAMLIDVSGHQLG
jgi:hypothetical protein